MIEYVLIIIFFSLTFLYGSWILIYFLPERKFREKKHFPKLSIILPAHNEENYIEDTIKSIVSTDYPNEKEIIVINDGSTDNTRNIVNNLTKKFTQIKLFNLKHQGKANSLNYGMKHARYETLVFLDADSILEKDSLKKLVQPLGDEKVSASSGVIRAKCTSNPLTWFQDFDYLLSSGWRFICNKINSVSVLPGFVAVKKKALIKVGGFSRDTLTEDFDVALTLRKAGYDLAMIPSAVIYTNVPNSLRRLFSQRIRWGRGTFQVARKHSDIFFSKKYGLTGFFSLPTQIYWYLFSLAYLPAVMYWMLNDYYRYFFSQNAALSLSALEFFFKWISAYGMLELIYRTAVGIYSFNFVFLFTISSWILTIIFTILIALKFSHLNLKHLAVYLFLFPYTIFTIFIQTVAFFYEFIGKSKQYNIWSKD